MVTGKIIKMRKYIFFLSVIMLSGFSNPAEQKSKMEPFSWIKGEWAMHMGRGTITESWKVTNDSTYSGESKMIKANGEVKPLENIQLVFRNKEYFYIPTTAGQNDEKPVLFKLTSFSQNGFVAENPDHDFPKRITYKLLNKDSIHAFIDDGLYMPVKRADFYFSRGD
jgi:hypothetical protein